MSNFKASYLSFSKSNALNRLLNDYLEKKDSLRPFYNFYPHLEGFKQALAAAPYSGLNRKLLTETLLKQAHRVENSSEALLHNINLLQEENTYTITGGHQLCLFTGPLYFIVKIFSAINLAEDLKKEFPDAHFVPVYWMASEDHDFAEVNHFYVNSTKVEWKSPQKGAVGHFLTQELSGLMSEIQKALGTGPQAKELLDLFSRAYLQHQNLADATRYLVNDLFGKYGLVVVDGDDVAFKQQFLPAIKNDLNEHTAFSLVGSSTAKLSELGYHAQIHAREINLFLLRQNSRLRIESYENGFRLQDGSKQFNKSEIETLLKEDPKQFSPNVVMRPLYQQQILPNLAYVGGPGELAYWLQLKAYFDAEKSFFPILVPRTFVTFVPKLTAKKMQQLQLAEADVFQKEETLIKQVQQTIYGQFDLSDEETTLKSLFSGIKDRAKKEDATLEAKVLADLQRTLNALEQISAKVNQARRRKMTEEKERLRAIKDSLFVGTTPRERHDNFSQLYLQSGPALFEQLKKHCHPLELKHLILTES